MNPKLFALLQYLVPQHLLSRAAGWVAECRWPWFKNRFISLFVNHYQVDMSQALEEDPKAYEHFNAFFTRALKPGARILAPDPRQLICPADGQISQIGQIEYGRIFQAKGHDFSLTELVGGDTSLADEFMNGSFATIYLSPRDYHRVHMPVEGTLRTMVHVPGKLFSVNQATAENIPGLFARNERVVAIFDTAQGPMAMILVGAMIVASIETVWAGLVAPPRREPKRTDYNAAARQPVTLGRGEEMGRFKLGSTVILLYPQQSMRWLESMRAGNSVRMGEALGTICEKAAL
ncbi:archaetidylserine decarboxylase [Aestuariirhabdus litorea]|uniref:Phosphatidylserine decarboxylase proenzyme n=1 Tax=Aestuariirhabdus litorea TaxID=2528527 RepID=A0A3P3VKR2_9GAMM|nr:archaetidylserine decarboxylase [Aestuariirhabdus litorea]RRJ82326.1 phosphatidylserine decarboxylase [Aestuariirhabdus litorea]RWW92491.1 phosphatidylserine decarboxylase [Endozoicomonadaceae bacterium GTF-13]